MHKGIHIEDEGTDYLPGSPEPSSRPAALGSTVIPFPFPQAATAALVGFEDEEADDTWEPVGLLAVKIVARWSLPRCTVFVRGDEREENSSPL